PLLHRILHRRGLHPRGHDVDLGRHDGLAACAALPGTGADRGATAERVRDLGKECREMTAPQLLGEKHVAIVNEHMRLENAYDFPGCTGVFGRAKYTLIADGELYDGADRVQYFLSQNHTAF